MNTLIVGGTGGLGLELAKLFKMKGSVVVTGRSEKRTEQELESLKHSGFGFEPLNLSEPSIFSETMSYIVAAHRPFSTVIYNAGFPEDGRIDQLDDQHILEMANTAFIGAAFLLQRILRNQKNLPCFIAVSSSSQFIPREREPIYTASKAALGMFANSLALDPRISKTLLAAPAGMQTGFWAGTDKDVTEMLDPVWVAQKIYDLAESEDFKFKSVKINRKPNRHIEVVETR